MVLSNLEPRFELKHTILVDELDEFNEILFFQRGTMLIGYEINKCRKYCLKYVDKSVIGAYGVTFNQRSAFIYTALTNCYGFSIRKQNWQKIIETNVEMGCIMKQTVLMQYITQIRSKVMVRKKRAIAKMFARNDHQMILASEYKDEQKTAQLLIDNMHTNAVHKSERRKAEIDRKTDMLYTKIEKYSKLIRAVLGSVEKRDALIQAVEKELAESKEEIA